MKGKTVIYLGDSYALPEGLVDSIRQRFYSIGYRFIDLPHLINQLSPLVFDFLFPGLESLDPYSLENRIKVQAGIRGKTGFLYKKSRYWYFRFREIPSSMFLEQEAEVLLDQLHSIHRVPLFVSPKWWKQVKKQDKTELYFFPELSLEEEEISNDVLEPEHSVPGTSSYFNRTDDSPHSHAQEVLTEIDRILSAYNLTLEELEVIIGYRVKLSKMKITRTGKIVLTDFENTEIKMDHLTKMVYFFYLRHPEGIRFKEVDNYRDELSHIYMGITGRDNLEEIQKSIIGHIDPYGSGLKVSASRIKRAFRDRFGEKVAKFYCLEGKKGEPYSIPIDRDYVIWEYPE